MATGFWGLSTLQRRERRQACAAKSKLPSVFWRELMSSAYPESLALHYSLVIILLVCI